MNATDHQDPQDGSPLGRDLATRADHYPAADGRRPDGAHSLRGRDLNSSSELFDGMAGIKNDPEMVALATQLVQRQPHLKNRAARTEAN